MRRGNERFGSEVRVRQLLCHERGEVPFDALEVASDPPGKAFVPEFTKPTQEALSATLRGRHQLDLHSGTHARTLRPSKTSRERATRSFWAQARGALHFG